MFGHPGGYRSRDVREERVIGVDLGGTNILAGLVLRDGTIGRTIEIATPDGDQAAVLGAIDGVVEDLLADGAAAIGYGSMYYALPSGCPMVHTYATPYYYCGGHYYQEQMQGDDVVYVVVEP